MPRSKGKPFERDVASRAGAPMGRQSDPVEDFSGPVHLERVPMVDGDYDAGGAYWGGGKPVYCVWDDEGHASYFRARDSNEARRELPAGWVIAPVTKSAKKRGKATSAEEVEILSGLARGPWAEYWAREQEEAGESLSGVDVYDAAPPTPESAEKWARALWVRISSANGGASLEQLYQAAVGAGFARDRESFGSSLGLQATGVGVSWDDDISGAEIEIEVPSSEYYG